MLDALSDEDADTFRPVAARCSARLDRRPDRVPSARATSRETDERSAPRHAPDVRAVALLPLAACGARRPVGAADHGATGRRDLAPPDEPPPHARDLDRSTRLRSHCRRSAATRSSRRCCRTSWAARPFASRAWPARRSLPTGRPVQASRRCSTARQDADDLSVAFGGNDGRDDHRLPHQGRGGRQFFTPASRPRAAERRGDSSRTSRSPASRRRGSSTRRARRRTCTSPATRSSPCRGKRHADAAILDEIFAKLPLTMARDPRRPMREAWIVEAVRTPVGRYGGALASVRPDDLAALDAPGRRRSLGDRSRASSRT